MYTFEAPIKTNRLTLRAFSPGDLDDLYAIHSRPDVARYLYWEPRTREQVRDVLQRKIVQTSLSRENDVLVLAIVLPDPEGVCTGVIGEVCLWWRSVEYRQGEIGYIMNPDYHGRGLATEAASAVLDLAFDTVGLHRVYGCTDVRNTASAALMRRLGMRQEAHFIHNEWFKGDWGDEYIFAILESEWRACQAKMNETVSR